MIKILVLGFVYIVKFILFMWVNKNIKVKNMWKCQRFKCQGYSLIRIIDEGMQRECVLFLYSDFYKFYNQYWYKYCEFGGGGGIFFLKDC